MTNLSQQSLEDAINKFWDNGTIALHPRWLVVSGAIYKKTRKILGRRGTKRYKFLQRRGARPKGCRS